MDIVEFLEVLNESEVHHSVPSSRSLCDRRTSNGNEFDDRK